MPRLIRRAPLRQRLWNFFEDLDTHISEFFSSANWEDSQEEWATPLGIVLNLVYLLARANSASSPRASDDVFIEGGISWFSWMCSLMVLILSTFGIVNAIYTFARKRHYRLFEASIDAAPSTPSARRVRVDSSPASGSPLSILKSLVAPDTAESRAHPDPERHVWELAVWNPLPLSLRLFSLFSPMHILIYCLFIPISSMDPRPSVTVVTVLLLNGIMSAMLLMLQNSFAQQIKDKAVIAQQAMHEYDTKFVHPNLHPVVRDVATQTGRYVGSKEVETHTPTTVINRGFNVNPNPAYASHYDPDQASYTSENASSNILQSAKKFPAYIAQAGLAARAKAQASLTPDINTSPAEESSGGGGGGGGGGIGSSGGDYSSPIRPSVHLPRPQAGKRQASPTRGDGGSLGVYSHAASPLRKAATANSMRSANGNGGLRDRGSSPVKRSGAPGGFAAGPGRGDGRSSGRWDDGGRKESSRYF